MKKGRKSNIYLVLLNIMITLIIIYLSISKNASNMNLLFGTSLVAITLNLCDLTCFVAMGILQIPNSKQKSDESHELSKLKLYKRVSLLNSIAITIALVILALSIVLNLPQIDNILTGVVVLYTVLLIAGILYSNYKL